MHTHSKANTVFNRCHDLPKRTGKTETDLRKYRNRLLWVPKRTSMGTGKGRVGYDRNNPDKVIYVLVDRYVGRYVCM